MLRHGSLFSGIGGFDLAAEWCGWENVFHCEWNEFGQRVLKHYWPEADSFGDITKTDFTKYRGAVDIISGGFPCQPYSSAGKRLGKEDERHLWPEMLRVIREVQPRYVVGENVYGLLNWNGGLVFDEVHSDLAAEGYETQAVVIPAAAVNAPHGRDRVWFVAKNTSSNGRLCWESQQEGAEVWQQRNISAGSSERIYIQKGYATNAYDNGSHGSKNRQSLGKGNDCNKTRQNKTSEFKGLADTHDVADSASFGLRGNSTTEQPQPETFGTRDRMGGENVADTSSSRGGQDNRNRKPGLYNQKSASNDWDNFPTQSPICGGNDGLPRELDRITFSKWRAESIKAYGNAIVPQVAYQIFKTIDFLDQNK